MTAIARMTAIGGCNSRAAIEGKWCGERALITYWNGTVREHSSKGRGNGRDPS